MQEEKTVMELLVDSIVKMIEDRVKGEGKKSVHESKFNINKMTHKKLDENVVVERIMNELKLKCYHCVNSRDNRGTWTFMVD